MFSSWLRGSFSGEKCSLAAFTEDAAGDSQFAGQVFMGKLDGHPALEALREEARTTETLHRIG